MFWIFTPYINIQSRSNNYIINVILLARTQRLAVEKRWDVSISLNLSLHLFWFKESLLINFHHYPQPFWGYPVRGRGLLLFWGGVRRARGPEIWPTLKLRSPSQGFHPAFSWCLSCMHSKICAQLSLFWHPCMQWSLYPGPCLWLSQKLCPITEHRETFKLLSMSEA